MGEGIETRLECVAQRTQSRLRRLRMAGRLRGFFREPVEFGSGKTIYIAGQAEHHRKVGFQEELRALLKRHEIEWDEKYVWD